MRSQKQDENAEQQQKAKNRSEGGGTKGLRHVEGDVPPCLKTKSEEKKTDK